MLKVSITSTALREMKGNGKASGKPYHLYFQTAYVHTLDKKTGKPHPYPEKTEIIVDRDEHTGEGKAYAIGEYQLHPASIYVGRNGDLSVAPILAPLKATS